MPVLNGNSLKRLRSTKLADRAVDLGITAATFVASDALSKEKHAWLTVEPYVAAATIAGVLFVPPNPRKSFEGQQKVRMRVFDVGLGLVWHSALHAAGIISYTRKPGDV